LLGVVYFGGYGRFASADRFQQNQCSFLSMVGQFCFQLVVTAVQFLKFVVVKVPVLQSEFVSGNGRVGGEGQSVFLFLGWLAS